MGFDVWYENPYLKDRYQYEFNKGESTNPESRISLLYDLWKQNTMPWMWDYEHYPDGKDDEIYGIFYPEDFHTILQLNHFEGQKKK